jgi:hypothetical protein
LSSGWPVLGDLIADDPARQTVEISSRTTPHGLGVRARNRLIETWSGVAQEGRRPGQPTDEPAWSRLRLIAAILAG